MASLKAGINQHDFIGYKNTDATNGLKVICRCFYEGDSGWD